MGVPGGGWPWGVKNSQKSIFPKMVQNALKHLGEPFWAGFEAPGAKQAPLPGRINVATNTEPPPQVVHVGVYDTTVRFEQTYGSPDFFCPFYLLIFSDIFSLFLIGQNNAFNASYTLPISKL